MLRVLVIVISVHFLRHAWQFAKRTFPASCFNRVLVIAKEPAEQRREAGEAAAL